MLARNHKVVTFVIGALCFVGYDCASSRKSQPSVSSHGYSYDLFTTEMKNFKDLDANYEIQQEAAPTSYSLHLFPSFTDGILRGEMVIEFVVTDETREIILNNTGLVIERTTVTDLVMGREVVSSFSGDKIHHNRFIIKTKSSLTPRKQYKVNIKYYSKHVMTSDTPFGFVWATRKYTENMRKEVADVATSFLEPIFSTKVFPAFDNPKYMTPFSISIARLLHHKTRCNLPLVEENQLNKDSRLLRNTKQTRHWDTFASSEPIPLFMVAFAVINEGFERIGKDVDGIKISVWAVRDVIQQAEFARIHAEKTIELMKTITKIDYPAVKISLIAVPNVSNSMEEKRWGPMFYLEDEILCVEELCPEEHKQRVIFNISEKLSLEWFGRYATRWNALWLKDALARYASYKISDMINREWNILDFVDTVIKSDLMFEDGRIMKHSLVKIGRITPLDIIDKYREDTREILVTKAASILRMLESVIGEYAFHDGMNHFMEKKTDVLASKFTRRASFYNKHVDSDPEDRNFNKETPLNNLWKAMEQQENNVNLPESISLVEAMNSWLNYRSYPLVTAIRAEGLISFSQISYHELEENRGNSKWIIPITIGSEADADFDNTIPSMWLTPNEKVTQIASPGDGWFIINLKNMAHYRATYDKDNWNLLIDQLKNNPEKIHPSNRAQLIADSHVLAADHRLDVDIPIKLSTYLVNEKQASNWIVAIHSFKHLYAALGRESRILYLAHFSKCLEHAYKRFEFFVTQYDEYDTRVLKSEMLSLLCWLGYKPCEGAAINMYWTNEFNLTNINPNLLYTVLCTVAGSGEITITEMNDKIAACTNLCQKKIMLQARSCFNHAARFEDKKRFYFNDVIDSANKNDERFRLRMEILSQWDCTLIFLDYIEDLVKQWSEDLTGPSSVRRSHIYAITRVVQNLSNKIYGNPEIETLNRIIRVMKTFDDDRYIDLLGALYEAKRTALPGGLKNKYVSPTDDGDKLKDVDVKAALDAYTCPNID